MNSSQVATRSDRLIVVGVAALFAIITLGSLLIGARANRNNEGENPPTYDCGSPFSYISGQARRPWRVADSPVAPTTMPGAGNAAPATPDVRMTDACERAMAPRLGFTVWVLVIGLLATTLLALTIPVAASAEERHVN